jgi:predicted RNA-binding protein with TRAM domain
MITQPPTATVFGQRDLRRDMDELWFIAGGVALVLLIVALLWWGRSSDTAASKQAHAAAQDREPPVEVGDIYEFGVVEFTEHHSGERIAVGKVEGFVLFTEDVPSDVSEGDVIRGKVLSFNEGRTSADATFVDTR